MTIPPPADRPDPQNSVVFDPGSLGEQFLAEWVTTKGGQILASRWHCIFGELDLVALNRDRTLVFIEVKTRHLRNLDADGALAITRRKQDKLWKAAQLFLLKHPQYAALPCRFDVALVLYRSLNERPHRSQVGTLSRFTHTINEHEFHLANYILSAIERS
jgi:putative endonuclease